MTEIKVGQKYTWLDNGYANGVEGQQIRITGQNADSLWTYVYDPNPGGYYNNSVGFTANNQNLTEGAVLVEDVESDSTDRDQPTWSEVKVGSKVTIRYTPTGEEFTTTAHEGEYGDVTVLGWALYSYEEVDAPQDIELLSVEQPKPVLPTTPGSVIHDANWDVDVFLTDDGWIDQQGDSRDPGRPDLGSNWSIIRDAGAEA